MNAAEIFPALERLRRSLGALFESIDSAEPQPEHLRTGLDTALEALASLGDPAALRTELPPAEHEHFDEKLVEVQRLMLILNDTTRRKSEETSKLLGKARLARKHLESLIFVEGRGKTCDLSG